MRATYSPEDNKLRLYPSERLSPEDYAKFKNAGFKWAPKQGLFVAPMWTPARFDLLESFAGEVGDEDTSLVERQEERAERFEVYSEKRQADALQAREQVKALSDGIPLGQPILIGHHSQRRAERDAQKIERGMQKAVSMWETSKYWQSRAAGALAHAKYKELPGVRARRIKKLGAEMRKWERAKKESVHALALWSIKDLSHEKALMIAGSSIAGITMARKPEDSPDYTRGPSAYDCLKPEPSRLFAPRTLQEVIETAQRVFPKSIERSNLWIEHYKNRIAYETAMLNEQGAGHLIEKKPRPKQAMILNYDGPVTLKGRYGNPPEVFNEPVRMTKAEYAKEYNKGCMKTEDGYRVRVAIVVAEGKPRYMGQWTPVYLTDQKSNKPEAQALAIAAE